MSDDVTDTLAGVVIRTQRGPSEWVEMRPIRVGRETIVGMRIQWKDETKDGGRRANESLK